MSVPDHGLDAIRKSAVELVDGDGSEFYLRTKEQGTPTISGSITATAIDSELKIKTKTIGSTAILLYDTVLDGRRIIMIQNKSATNILYVGTNNAIKASTVDDSDTDGWEVGPSETLNTPSGPNATWYGICEAGKTALVKIGQGK